MELISSYYHLLDPNIMVRWIITLLLITSLYFLLVLTKRVLIHYLKHLPHWRDNPYNTFLSNYLESIPFLFWLTTAFYLTLFISPANKTLFSLIQLLFFTLTAYQLTIFLFQLTDVLNQHLLTTKKETNKAKLIIFNYLAKATILTFVTLTFLASLGINITSLVAGLGIGGLAIALAVQNILGDLFSTLAIVFDNTVNVGDFIVVDQYQGKVEKIGLKTTRIRSFKGEEIIIPNKELSSQVVRNFHSMKQRRVNFNLSISYETSLDKIKKIPQIISQIIDQQPHAKVKRVNLTEMADSALIFSVVYELETKDYSLYLQTQEAIILQILNAFAKEKIALAYPTQTIYLKKSPGVHK